MRIKNSLNKIKNGLKEVTSNKHFSTVLKVVLKIGNILNEKTLIGDAEGFEISTLKLVYTFKFKQF